MNSQIQLPKWYAIYTRSRFEKKIFTALQKSGTEVFLPLIKEKRRWSDRLKTIQVPLLPSYVFIKTCLAHSGQYYYFPGFVKFISQEGKPCEIKEEDINFLKKITTSGLSVRATKNFELGECVRIVRGPLKGWEGTVKSQKGKSMVVFQFESLQQAINVEVPSGDLELVK